MILKKNISASTRKNLNPSAIVNSKLKIPNSLIMYTIKIKDNIHWIGANDRRTHLFENLHPIERGVSYNSYIIVDDKIAIIDTIESSFQDDYISRIKSLVGDREVDYLIINHIEPDHSGAIRRLVNEYPNIAVVGTKLAMKLLDNFYGLKPPQHVVKGDDTLSLGKCNLRFINTPWLHWPETMMTYETGTQVLFSGDAFGSFGALEGGLFDDELDINRYKDEMLRYYANIVGKYTAKVISAFEKLSSLTISTIAPTHGPVWRSQINTLLDMYKRWSSYESINGAVVVYGSMYGRTEQMADYIARRLAENSIKEIRIYDASKTHKSYIIADIWKYKCVILGCPTYNGELFPAMHELVAQIEMTQPADKITAFFSTAAWNGVVTKKLTEFAERISWEIVAPPVEWAGQPSVEDLRKLDVIAHNVAQRLING